MLPVALVVGAAAAYHYGPSFSELPTAGVRSLIPTGMPSERAEKRSAQIFGSSLLPRILVVQRDPGGISLATQARIVRHAVRLDRGELAGFPRGSIAAPYVNTVKLFPAARERSTTAITYLAFPGSIPSPQQRILAVEYANELSAIGPPARVTGFIAGSLEESQAINQRLSWIEILTPLAIALIIGVYLRALLAPLVTLAAAGISYLLSARAVTFTALHIGATLQKEVRPVVDVLLLGVATDYCIFFLVGGRHRLSRGDTKKEAARWAAGQYIPIIFTAAWLVALGLSTLRVASIGFVQGLGPAMAIVVLITMAVCVMLVPAAIAIFGKTLYWPGESFGGFELGARLRSWITARLTNRFVAALTVVLIVGGLGAAGWGIGRAELGLTPIRGLDANAPAAIGAREAAAGFAGGIVSPTEIVLQKQGIAARPGALVRLSALIDRVPGVAATVGAGLATVAPIRPYFISRRHHAARYLVVLDHSPYGAKAIDDLGRLQAAMPGLLRRVGLGGATVQYAGDTAISADTVHRIRHDIMWVAAAAFAVNFALLVFFLRALVAPLLLIGASALALAATFGISTFFFQGLLGYPELTYYVPLAVGVLLLSFGSDYNVFVVGRIWQESQSEGVRPTIRRVAPGVSRAVSMAGFALAASFAMLALVPLSSFYEFAFAMGVGILIDTFVVRSYLIPAMLALAGSKSWWPSSRSEPRRRRAARPRLTEADD